MTEKQFKLYEHKGNDYILDNPKEHLDFIEMLGDALTSEEIVDLLNELHEENNELRLQLNICSDQRNEFHRGARENANRVGKLEKENEQLKRELFEARKDYILETYADNPIRRDEKLKELLKEFDLE